MAAGDRRLRRLADWLLAAEQAVVLTGAGVSTESGIPDFRGPNGLWRDPELERLADLATFQRSPELTWRFYGERLARMSQQSPNAGHQALAALEARGLVRAIVTQNVDGLHRQAGSEPIEVHGSLDRCECLACRKRFPIAVATAALAATAVPPCPLCQGPLKPGVTLFGELLPEEAIDEAYRLIAGCDLLLVCGSSLMVWPVSSFPSMVQAQGGRLAILNRGLTDFDAAADLRLDGALGDLLPRLVAAVDACAASATSASGPA